MSAIFQSNFVEINGLRLHYVSSGPKNAKLILFLHGFPEFWYSWRHQLEWFSNDYHVVALDQRGYNLSDKPKGVSSYLIDHLADDILEFIRVLGYERCILVGHDWGGAVAWKVALTYPERLDKLIILNMPHPALFFKGLLTIKQILKSWYIFFFQLPWLPEWTLRMRNFWLLRLLFRKTTFHGGVFSTSELDKYVEAIGQPQALTAMINYYRCVFHRLPQYFPESWDVEVPTLMLWGENDFFLRNELTKGTERYVPNLTFITIPECSHWTQIDQPDLVNRYITEFLMESEQDANR